MFKKPVNQQSELILETSLQSFFFDQLLEVNKKFQSPLPNETIYYSSLVMDKFGHSNEYYETVDGRVRNKILGIKLMESTQLERKEQQRSLQDIGDTALLMCGYFYDSINEKLVDYRYYQEIGQAAYSRLDAFVPSFYDVNSFYKILSSQFETLANLMQMVQKTSSEYQTNPILLFANHHRVKAS
ncbi:hypothetical protein [Bacteriovorax sp. Seq25_V]|uniref:hypothetical protein n=1 Tax=Bacteriovorax sp. Seq25_V TaxID=1201288 RepID=UPI00038A3206|nr:hypothetical protein [Bacteriovorax sp. Seq25_V]EQC46816.1 hypothetical protein M900_2650 [Bacteriovorax sp. Seq25_V]